MNTVDFCNIFGEINEAYVLEAHREKSSAGKSAGRCLAAAACLCLLAGAVFFAGKNLATPAPVIINRYQTEGNTKYKAPAPGEFFCFVEVEAAREQYRGREAKFLLAMDVFDAEGAQVSPLQLGGELRRLAELGYDLHLTNLYEQDGDTVIAYPVVAGLFTEEQLAAFPVTAEYGYAFHFPAHMDGTALTEAELGVTEDEPVK